MNEIPSTHEIPIPEGLEQRLSALVDRLEAEERGRTSEMASASQASRASTRPLTRRASVAATAFAIAAVFVAVAILVIAPQVKERRELARYEGSYTLRDGQRIDDLGSIKAEISEALAMAQVAEANVPTYDLATEAEHAILQATADPEMRAVVHRILEEQ